LSVAEDKDVKMEDIAMKREIEYFIKGDLNDQLGLPDLIKHMAKKFSKDYSAMRYHIMKFGKGSNPFIRFVETEDKRVKKVRLT